MVSSSSIPFTKTFQLLFYLFFFSFNATILNWMRLRYLMWGEAEAAGGIGEDSQVVPQRPAGTATSSGCTFSLPSLILLAQTLELSLGANLNQSEKTDDLSAFQSLIAICSTKTLFHMRRFAWSSSVSFEEKETMDRIVWLKAAAAISKWENLNLGFFHLTHGVDGLQAPEAGWVLRAKHQLSQVLACAQTQRDRLRTGQIDDWRWLSSWDLAG